MEINDNNATQRYRQLAQEAHDDAMMYRGKLEAAEARIAELERKAEVHAVAEEVQIALREKVQEERDAALEREAALAAYVERLTAALNHSMLDWIICGMATNGRLKEDGPMAMYQELKNALTDKPATSITRRDLIKQSEALGNLAKRKQRESDAEEDCSLRAKQAYAAVCAANESNKLRQQAERVRKDELPT